MVLRAQPKEGYRILVVSTQFPFPPRSGFETRVHQLARHLASRHRVTVLSYVDKGRDGMSESAPEHVGLLTVERRPEARLVKRLRQAMSAVSTEPFAARQAYTPEMQKAIDAVCASHAFDIVQLESSVLCKFRFPIGPRLILDEHNIEYEVFERIREAERSLARRTFSRLECTRFRRFEQGWWKKVDGCAVTSEREQGVLRAYAPETPMAVVPNGVDLDYFRPVDDAPQGDTAVFNGVLNYRPNLDAAFYLVEEIWPRVVEKRPNATLTIVGRGESADAVRRLRRPGVVVTGEVPDVRPYLANAAVVLVPIRMGGGTRLKVVEALAMARPLVSTSLGCEGINVRDGEHLLVTDEAATFAAAVIRLFEDAQLGRALGRAGRERMEQEYSWERATAQLEQLYERVLDGAAGRRGRRTNSVAATRPA